MMNTTERDVAQALVDAIGLLDQARHRVEDVQLAMSTTPEDINLEIQLDNNISFDAPPPPFESQGIKSEVMGPRPEERAMHDELVDMARRAIDDARLNGPKIPADETLVPDFTPELPEGIDETIWQATVKSHQAQAPLILVLREMIDVLGGDSAVKDQHLLPQAERTLDALKLLKANWWSKQEDLAAKAAADAPKEPKEKTDAEPAQDAQAGEAPADPAGDSHS